MPKRTAFITGASSRIGAIYADRLAKRGYDLVLVARDANLLDDVAARVARTTARDIDVLVADLTVKSELSRVEVRLREDRSITALINCAGFEATGHPAHLHVEDPEDMIQLNVVALTRLTLAVLPRVVERGTGMVVNVAPAAPTLAVTSSRIESAIKSYVVALTQTLYQEMASRGVRVQAVLPLAATAPIWSRAGLTVEEIVDVALSGFDIGEMITIPCRSKTL